MSIEIPLAMPVRGPGAWTQDMEMFLADKYSNSKMTSAEIQRALNDKFKTQFTRNAVIGKINRLGLREKHVASHTARAKPKPGRPRLPGKSPAPAPMRNGSVFRPAVDRPSEIEVEPEEPTTGAVGLMGLREGICHWPLGPMHARPPYEYCGARAFRCEGGTFHKYCAAHYRQGIDPTKNLRWRKRL